MQQNQKTIRDTFMFCNCPQIANLLQFFKFICKPSFLINFFLILYRDTCIGDTSIDVGIDLTPLQSIVYRYQ